MEKVNEILKKYWKIDCLKDKQSEIITNYIEGKDVIGLLPTGYGKSLCYLLPPLITDKVIFIISPLISLMEDQKEKLIEMNIPVATLHGNNINKDKEIYDIIDNKINIVYMSPEYLINGNGFELAKTIKKKLGFMAIDESHCISTWGHDFRNEYLSLYKFREKYPKLPIMAITATATNQVLQDIITHLRLKDPIITIANFDRPNIYLKCIKVKSLKTKTGLVFDNYIQKYEGHKIIIYTSSRTETETISKMINDKYGKISVAYHAGMTKIARTKVQNKFNSGSMNIVVATVAFGMGIDQTVRCVLICGMPKSIEEYYQMIGRAGRDEEAAESIFFFQDKNLIIGKKMISEEDPDIKNHKYNSFNNIDKYYKINTCRRYFILEYFGQIPKFFWCEYCDNCCESELIDYTDKFIQVVFKTNNYKLIFSEKEIAMLNEYNLINTKSTIGCFKLMPIMINWKKIIEINNYLEKKIPKKYLIMLKK